MRQRLKRAAWAWVIVGCWCAATPAALPAQELLRVCRRGVIYYHFSSRPGSKSDPARAPKSGTTPTRTRPLARPLSPADLTPHIHQAGREHNLPPALIKALIRVESNFNPAATSPKGAQGLMQLMPETASELKVQDPYDVRENIWGGTRYFHRLLSRFNYQLPLALAAYNAGPRRVDRTLAVPKIPETENFVRQVCAQFLRYRAEEVGPPATRQ